MTILDLKIGKLYNCGGETRLLVKIDMKVQETKLTWFCFPQVRTYLYGFARMDLSFEEL